MRILATAGLGAINLYNWKTWHLSGFFGLSSGVESVTMLITCCLSSFSLAKISMVLPYDLLIFWPSVPGTTATSFSISGSGSLKVSPKMLLKFVAMSRVISMCCFWSWPTGTMSG